MDVWEGFLRFRLIFPGHGGFEGSGNDFDELNQDSFLGRRCFSPRRKMDGKAGENLSSEQNTFFLFVWWMTFMRGVESLFFKEL